MWCNQFSAQVLPTLVPFTSWKEEYPNREVGDIVLIHYPGLKKAQYRLSKVSKALPDEQGNVSTVEVLMRHKDQRSDGLARYTPKDLEPKTVPVERTVLLMPRVEVIANTPNLNMAATALSPTIANTPKLDMDATAFTTTVLSNGGEDTKIDDGAVSDVTLGSGYILSTNLVNYVPAIVNYVPAMYLKEYGSYENFKKETGDMKCEPESEDVNA